MKDALTWFEIPVERIGRAQQFYEEVLQVKLRSFQTGEPMEMFPAAEDGVGGALVERPGLAAAAGGTLVYLRLDGSTDEAMARVERAGGTIATPKTAIDGVPGTFFSMRDTEGNTVGVHGRG